MDSNGDRPCMRRGTEEKKACSQSRQRESSSAMCGNFFPPEYKSFPFAEGDLLSHRSREGKYSISKVLKIDRITLKKGDTINIQRQAFVAPEDDFLLIISCAF